MADRRQLVRDVYTAWRSADRELIEQVLADGYTFSSPPDPGLDRAGYFERCWPMAGTNAVEFEFLRLVEVGDEVLVTYVGTRPDGTRFQNTEIFAFDGDRVARTEVYFGWDLA
jgi:ketosteroid isomerase-like protein